MARRPARLVAALATAAGLLAAAGCGALTDLVNLQLRIESAGYDVGNIFHDDFVDGRNVVEVAASTDGGTPPPEGQRVIAEIAWDTYPRRFERIDIVLDDDERAFDRFELQEAFGARDPDLDERTFSDDVRQGVFVALGIGLAVLVAVIVLIVLLVRRSRRKRLARLAAVGPAGPYGAPPPTPYYGVPAPPPWPGAGQQPWTPPSGYPPPAPGTMPPPPVPPPPGPPPGDSS